jgi:glycosyltransferase involved in cell wall biosynthesis
VAWELTEGLNRAGVRTDVLCAHHLARGVQERAPSGYRIRRAGSLGQVLSTSNVPSMPWHLARMAHQADIVHLHMPDPMAAAAFWTVRPRARLVVHWHSDVIRQRRALKAYEPLQDWLLARADAVVATSPPYAESSAPLRRWRDKVAVVPIGISDNRGSACSQKAAAIRQRYRGRRLVFALGRMTYYKGFDVLVEAAAALSEHCAVLIGGDGELLDHYRTMVARRGLAGKVHLLGHILDDDLASHFEACDLFCMSSTVRAEAYGVAILEAMVMGKPVVATDIGGSGVPWVNRHGETGLNVPAGDAPALAAALNRLLDDDALRARMGAAARRR